MPIIFGSQNVTPDPPQLVAQDVALFTIALKFQSDMQAQIDGGELKDLNASPDPIQITCRELKLRVKGGVRIDVDVVICYPPSTGRGSFTFGDGFEEKPSTTFP